MTPKEELNQLVSVIKSKAKNERRVLRNEDIAARLELDATYFATLVGKRGNVTDKHLSLLKAKFKDELDNSESSIPDAMPIKESDMKTEDVYLVGVHRYAFRAGDPAKIMGLKMCTPDGKRQRLCYEVRFDDGTTDYVAVSDLENGFYEIFTLQELIHNGIPEIIH